MIDSVRDFLAELLRTIRVADLFDIALVAGFLFLIFTWVQQISSRQASRSLFVVATVFTLIYVLARFFEMYLVETLIELLLVVLLIATVVAFQSDMRRLIQRVGTWRAFRDSADESPSATVDMLTQAVAKMAASRTGALIALRGREPWEHLIQGGIPLEGTVSQPILYSIFNPNAPGHDGAILLEGDRILKFAAHLPLSSRLPEVSRFGGTRHTAALGLAEQCDAFVIVVSEERGTISVAHEGRLVPVASASELKERLTAFWRKYYDAQLSDRPAWWRRQAPRTALLSMLLATMLWLLLAYRPDTVYRVFTVPIELRNLEDTQRQLVGSAPPSEARVTLAGSDLAFESLDPSTLVVSIDVGEAEEGHNEIVIGEDDLPLPPGLRLYQVEPASVPLHLQRVRSVQVPVDVQTVGQVPDSLMIVDLHPEPDTVQILVPEEAQDAPAAVSTRPVELGRITQSSTVEADFALPDGVKLAPEEESTVSVRVRVRSVE